MARRLDLLWVGLSLALASLSLTEAAQQRSWDAFAYFALHAQAAILFWRRIPPTSSRMGVTQTVVPAVGLLYAYAFELHGRTVHGEAFLFAGCLLCLVASQRLGRSYGVLPAVRLLETGGAYSFVRHPIYAAYLLMDVGLVFNTPTLWNLAVLGTGVMCYLWRIVLEERALAVSPAHAGYLTEVPFKLVPGLY
jgi:protein-S-isoprenylcysteine O-methyltransferase Ste14